MVDEPTQAVNLEQPKQEPKQEPTAQAPVEPKAEPKAEPQQVTIDQIPEEVLFEAMKKKLRIEGITDPAMLDQYAQDAQAALRREFEAAEKLRQAEEVARKLSFEESLGKEIVKDYMNEARTGQLDESQLLERFATRIIATTLGATNRATQYQLNSLRNQEREADKMFREHPELQAFKAPIEQAIKEGNPPTGVMNFWLQRLEEMKAAGVNFPERKPNLQAVQGGLSQSAYQSFTEPVGGQDSVIDENYAKAARERAEQAEEETIKRWLEETADY